MLTDILQYLLIFLGLSSFVLFFKWREEVFNKKHIQRAIYLADKKFNFVEKIKPEHFIPTHHFILEGEKVSSYEDRRTYEVLRDAKFFGEHIKESEIK